MDKRQKIVKLRQEGLTIRAIQEKLKLSSPSLVQHYLVRHNEPLLRISKPKLVSCLRRYHDFLREMRENGEKHERGECIATVEIIDELISQLPVLKEKTDSLSKP